MNGDSTYSWGGEGAHEGGYDCSGYACTALMEAARPWPDLYDGGRTTAQGLLDYYKRRGCAESCELDDLAPGCLAFYRRPGRRIHHVAIHATSVPTIRLDQGEVEFGPMAFESGGGGSTTTSPRQALLRSAGVRMTATDYHGRGVEWVAVDPFALLS